MRTQKTIKSHEKNAIGFFEILNNIWKHKDFWKYWFFSKTWTLFKNFELFWEHKDFFWNSKQISNFLNETFGKKNKKVKATGKRKHKKQT